MKTKAVFLFFSLCVSANTQGQSIWDKNHLEAVKQSLSQPAYAAAYQELLNDADRALNQEPLSVLTKAKKPASGDMHDYMSQARYFWPDPSKPDGLPYINRDGESNPEIEQLDRNRLGELANRVTTLSLAWYFSGEEKYAHKAAVLIRVWFFKSTRMNPNLNYAQMIPGHNNGKGRCYGVIDTYSFVEMLDAVQLLEHSKAFTKGDSKQLKEWFGQLLKWILTSEQGQEEARQKNNHSVAYDAQAIAFALYAGDREVATRILTEFPEKRIFKQIDPDGKQPHELTRTLAFHYSMYNIHHIIDIFLMGQKMGIAIDNATSADGRNFYKAVDFLTPYLGKDVSAWHPYQQISGWEEAQQALTNNVYRAYLLNPSRKDYLQIYLNNRVLNVKDRFSLLYV
ncbi:alginate lyase [Bacteroidia bacterium]|nr:alginate lyase [Bacteroidia bacterium]